MKEGTNLSDEELMKAQVRACIEIEDILANILVRYSDLPETVQVMVRESETRLVIGAYFKLKRVGNKGATRAECLQDGQLREEFTVAQSVDRLIGKYPGMPLLCNGAVSQELREDRETIEWKNDDGCHFVLGRKGGLIDIYTPVPYKKISPDQLPPSVSSGQFFI